MVDSGLDEFGQPGLCLPLMAVFSRHLRAIDWGRGRAEAEWGPVVLESPLFDFTHTNYYEATMGSELKKVFWAFERLMDPGRLADRKRASIRWEADYAARGDHGEERPINLDPGYLTEAKLVLATTKDRDHRVYLDRGVFAEVTLSYQRRGWHAHRWTYPDYRSPEYHQFLTRCRHYLRERQAEATD